MIELLLSHSMMEDAASLIHACFQTVNQLMSPVAFLHYTFSRRQVLNRRCLVECGVFSRPY